MAVLQVRIDDELKRQATEIYDELGLDLSTAVRMFLKRSVLVKGIPFGTTVDESTLQAIIAINRMREISEANGNSNMSLEEINDEIKRSRKENKKKS